ncbi:MAG TPA: DUF2634 domain-containing protein [Lachnospiraceae bacterium]|nr:DUF2634 domain-containing protein [Lachnospiraceae bacterium]
MATLPEGVGLSVSVDYIDRPTNTFIIDWASRQISGMDSGLAAMRQAVDIILQNERFKWQIYSSNFGSELEGLIGEEYDYIISEVPRRIREAFSIDNRILSVENFSFSEQKGNSIACSFDVVTVFGTFGKEVVF